MAAKIESLQLDNFLCLEGDGSTTPIEFGGKNLLVYGENGSGKTAIYRALKGLFAIERPGGDFGNVFNAGAPWAVRVGFDDGTEAAWDAGRHPAAAGAAGYSEEVNKTARRSGFLDYRALAGATRENIFDLLVGSILSEFQGLVNGKSQPLFKIYHSLRAAVPKRATKGARFRFNEASVAFNTALTAALGQLLPDAKVLLAALAAGGSQIDGFHFPGVVFSPKERRIGGEIVEPRFSLNGHAPPRAAEFFNEARLTALAVAIFLGGRLACTPKDDDTLKLLVLDDVLISLDMEHRMPLLNLLRERFGEWQIALLTHNQDWYNVARDTMPGDAWACVEMGPAAPAGRPSVCARHQDRVLASLATARRHLDSNSQEAAAGEARRALELKLKKLCDGRIPVRFHQLTKNLKLQDLVDAVEKCRPGVTASVRAYRWLVLNPGAHADAALLRPEIEAAIAEIEKLHQTVARL